MRPGTIRLGTVAARLGALGAEAVQEPSEYFVVAAVGRFATVDVVGRFFVVEPDR